MWSFAVLLWELVTREVPFADLSHMEIGMKVSGRRIYLPAGIYCIFISAYLYPSEKTNQTLYQNIWKLLQFSPPSVPQVALEGLRPTIPPGISPHICKLMRLCMNEDPAKRPKFDMIVPILEKMQDK